MFNTALFRVRAAICVAATLVLTINGCNSDSANEVVDPPPITTDLASETTPEAPGGIELPSGDIADADGGPDSTSGGLEMPDSDKGQSAQSTEVTLDFVTWEDAKKTASTTGKVTVLDIWSTACIPCMKELPGLVEIHNEMNGQVTCMTLSVDFDGRKSKPAQTYEKEITDVLSAVKATFTNMASTTASDDVYAAAEIESIPAVLVFDADGKLVKKFVDAGDGAGFSYHKDVTPFVKSLLK